MFVWVWLPGACDPVVAGRIDHTADTCYFTYGRSYLSRDERCASYLDLADHVRAWFTDPTKTLAELFRRVVVNICVSNTDDHARNHAAFWDGTVLTLTPAYDISPSLRSGDTATQAMALTRDGRRASRLELCRQSAAEYLLTPAAANDIIDEVVTGIEAHFEDVAAHAGLTDAEHTQLWQRLILHPSIHDQD